MAVAVDIGVDRIVDRPGRRSAATCSTSGSAAHHRGEHDVEHVVESAAQMVEEVLAVHPGVRCLGIGVSVPGAVRDTDGAGAVRAQPGLGRRAVHRRCSSQRLGRPVFTGNDANLGVLAEHLRGAAVGHSDVAYLNGSVGIGGGFLVGGVPLLGCERLRRRGRAPAGRRQQHQQCRCGNVGCWETKVGENQLLDAGRTARRRRTRRRSPR